MPTFSCSKTRTNRDFAKELSKKSTWTTILVHVQLTSQLIFFFSFAFFISRSVLPCEECGHIHLRKDIAVILFSLNYHFCLFSFFVAKMLWIFDATATVLKDWACSSLLCDTKGINCEKQGAHILCWYCMYFVSWGLKSPVSFGCKIVTFPQLSSYR